jgi:septation ring formation regulator EzrA
MDMMFVVFIQMVIVMAWSVLYVYRKKKEDEMDRIHGKR